MPFLVKKKKKKFAVKIFLRCGWHVHHALCPWVEQRAVLNVGGPGPVRWRPSEHRPRSPAAEEALPEVPAHWPTVRTWVVPHSQEPIPENLSLAADILLVLLLWRTVMNTSRKAHWAAKGNDGGRKRQNRWTASNVWYVCAWTTKRRIPYLEK